jgi:2'-5' RNA ligase
MRDDERRTIRSFIAVDLPEPARGAAAGVSRALRSAPGGADVRWVRPETLHVTLRFLGQVETSRVAGLAAQVAGAIAGIAPFRLTLGGLQVFPGPSRPRVVALEIAPAAPLAALAAAVERGVVAAGFEPEPRRFRPHLTLGRVRGRAAPDVAGVAPPPPSPFEVSEAVLFRSDLGSQGAHYTPLERMSLGGSIHPDQTQRKER